MKVNIISSFGGWIIQKFGECVYHELKLMGVDVVLSKQFDFSADINHYFREEFFPTIVRNKTTFFITHVDSVLKLERVKNLTNQGAVGICMSRQTMNYLISCGVSRDRVCYIHPAQDGVLIPHKIKLGFTHKTHYDDRNRETILIDICKYIRPEAFKFAIMGSGWDAIVAQIRDLGFEVEYYSEFDKEKYNKLIPTLDYYCFFGFDEGSMGFLDAVAAGIDTIVTPQGYHLDTDCGITYPVRTINDIVRVLHEIEEKRERHIRFAQEWTWKNYTLKHLEIWKYLLGVAPRKELLKNRGWYEDGIFSLLLDFPYPDMIIGRVPEGCNIIIWGAGNCGIQNYNYIKSINYCNIVLWVDAAYKEKQALGLHVLNVDAIFSVSESDYDYIFIAILNRNIAEELKNNLLEHNVPEDKIVLACNP